MTKIQQSVGVVINHEDLLDMPDVAGVNPDHDARYPTLNGVSVINGLWTFATHPLGIDHTQIANIGVNTHPQIDNHIADQQIHVSTWATATNYFVGMLVKRGNTLWLCLTNHLSGTFYIDWLTNNYWVAIGDHPGQVKFHARAGIVAGYLFCDNSTVGNAGSGATYAGDQYRELYEFLNNTFGGVYNWAGGNTINLLDARGIFIRGAGTSGKLTNANGAAFAGTLGTYQNDKMQGHIHTFTGNAMDSHGHANTFAISPSSHRHEIKVPLAAAFAVGTTDAWEDPDENPTYYSREMYTQYTSLSITGSVTSASAGTPSGTISSPSTDSSNGTPRTGEETNPANLGLNFIIKY